MINLSPSELSDCAQRLVEYSQGIAAPPHTAVLPGTVTPALEQTLRDMWAAIVNCQSELAEQGALAATVTLGLVDEVSQSDHRAAAEAARLGETGHSAVKRAGGGAR